MKLVKKEDGNLKMELEKLPEGVPEDKWDMPWPWNGNCGWNLNRKLIGWSLQYDGGAMAKMELTKANPMNKASALSLEMIVTPPEQSFGRVALVNSGYWGINVQAETSYKLTFYLRSGTYEGELTAALETKNKKVLASHEFEKVKPSTSWQKYTATLKATDSDPQAQFVLSFRGRSTRGAIENERWYDISLVVGKNRAEMFLDDRRVGSARVEYLSSFFATAGYDRQDKMVVLRATNYNGKPVRADIELNGAKEVGKKGQHIVICSEGQYDQNTLDNPRRIVPQEQALSDCAKSFSVTLAPYSVNVLRIPAWK